MCILPILYPDPYNLRLGIPIPVITIIAFLMIKGGFPLYGVGLNATQHDANRPPNNSPNDAMKITAIPDET